MSEDSGDEHEGLIHIPGAMFGIEGMWMHPSDLNHIKVERLDVPLTFVQAAHELFRQQISSGYEELEEALRRDLDEAQLRACIDDPDAIKAIEDMQVYGRGPSVVPGWVRPTRVGSNAVRTGGFSALYGMSRRTREYLLGPPWWGRARTLRFPERSIGRYYLCSTSSNRPKFWFDDTVQGWRDAVDVEHKRGRTGLHLELSRADDDVCNFLEQLDADDVQSLELRLDSAAEMPARLAQIIGRLTDLRRLCIRDQRVDTRMLHGLRELESLDLTRCTGFTEQSLADLSGCPFLTYLFLNRTDLPDAAFDHCPDFYELELLHVGWTGVSRGRLDQLMKLTALVNVGLGGLDLRDEDLPLISGKSPDRPPYLWLDDNPQLSDAAVATLVQQIPELQWFSASKADLGIAFAGAIAQCRELRRLFLADIRITTRMLRLLTRPRQLEQFALKHCGITDAQGEQLGVLRELRRLDLEGNPCVADRTAAAIRRMPRLQTLDLHGTRVGDVELGATLRNAWPHFKTICLDGTRIGDHTLAALGRQRRLTWVGLGGTAITDSGLQCLATCEGLRHVEVDRCPSITPAGIAALRDAKPGLRISSDFTDPRIDI